MERKQVTEHVKKYLTKRTALSESTDYFFVMKLVEQGVIQVVPL